LRTLALLSRWPPSITWRAAFIVTIVPSRRIGGDDWDAAPTGRQVDAPGATITTAERKNAAAFRCIFMRLSLASHSPSLRWWFEAEHLAVCH